MLRKLFSLSARDEELKERFLEYLRNKYQEDFFIGDVSRVDWDFGVRYHANFTPVSNPNLKSEITASRKKKILGDTYMNEVMSEKLDTALADLANHLFGQELLLYTYLEPRFGKYPPAAYTNKNMNINDYLDDNLESLEYNIWLFVKRDTDIDFYTEAEQINRFADKVQEHGFNYLDISVSYVKPSWFEKIKQENKYTWDHRIDDYYLNENAWALGDIVVMDSEKIVDFTDNIIEEIVYSFEEKKKYFE